MKRRPLRIEKEFRFDSNHFWLVCDGESNVGGYKRHACYNLILCYKHTDFFDFVVVVVDFFRCVTVFG